MSELTTAPPRDPALTGPAFEQDYEQATIERNRLQSVRALLERQRVANEGAGSYDAVATNLCGPAVSNAGVVSVSRCGSADVLEALGVNITAPPPVVARTLEAANIAFFFAPTFHPSMKHAAQTRRELGIRMVIRHKAVPGGIHQQGTLPANGLGDHEGCSVGRGRIQQRGMELDELDIGDAQSGLQRKRDTVTKWVNRAGGVPHDPAALIGTAWQRPRRCAPRRAGFLVAHEDRFDVDLEAAPSAQKKKKPSV